jgi:hypothetical protein
MIEDSQRMDRIVRSGVLTALAAVLLAGCNGTGEDRLGQGLVAPGGYDFYDCAQLSAQEKSLNNRRTELTRLMDKAKQGPAGGLVSAVTYEPDYASNLASLREVHRAQAEKNCAADPAGGPPRRSDTIIR